LDLVIAHAKGNFGGECGASHCNQLCGFCFVVMYRVAEQGGLGAEPLLLEVGLISKIAPSTFCVPKTFCRAIFGAIREITV